MHKYSTSQSMACISFHIHHTPRHGKYRNDLLSYLNVICYNSHTLSYNPFYNYNRAYLSLSIYRRIYRIALSYILYTYL